MRKVAGIVMAALLSGCGGSSTDSTAMDDVNQQPQLQSYTFSGTLFGLHESGLELSLGNQSLYLGAGATAFSMQAQMAPGDSYTLAISTTPAFHSCTIDNGTGTVSGDVSQIAIHCLDERVGADLTHLPVGDSLILDRSQGDESPQAGKLWLCGVPPDGAGAAASDDWINADGTWNYIIKPQVEGENYALSEFTVIIDGDKRLVTGNALPTTAMGTFPIEPGTIAYNYDRNPSVISEHDVKLTFDAVPQKSEQPLCVGFGATGISLTGAAIYHGSSTLGTDAAAFEILDACGGHADGTSTYHYHYMSQCVLDELDPDNGGHSALMGYIMDGFGIFGPRGEDGEVLSSADLDQCHGHSHEIEWDGELRDMYHYHWTYDFPYNVGCYNNEPQIPWNGRAPQ
ncbi:YHYH protein [Aliiglaciecola sp. CAU 1673]|uniref:YHYH protein n=1 Tax=Aliiglaciecola sp. CAU 1673 TaxID=3032595 RepID=UPI0023D9FB12|nr:YHYH protein [Aliiglaciecola sp. CAU 1673]MDF2179809.1 YHYH protein [Aliiglaciecola sp. CAU 1673]